MSIKSGKHHCLWLAVTLLLIIGGWMLAGTIKEIPFQNEVPESPSRSPSIHSGMINEILDAKVEDFTGKGYFPQIYYPSLQATYYSLSILDKIGRLYTISQTYVKEYIMECYNSTNHVFMDLYSCRYLDTDIMKDYYPFSSLLEANCYAILSLDILDSLSLIDTQASIDFIWSCYNPSTSGFIGQAYKVNLPDHFKTATMDNTYFALLTLNLLMPDWDNYIIERDELLQYIQSLQSTNTHSWYFGGFYNDEDHSLDSLRMFEPNLLSAYYCIKALEIFNLVQIIRVDDFHQYLDGVYHDDLEYFDMAYNLPTSHVGNIVATGLGLSVSDATDYPLTTRTELIDFILDNRNTRGTWNYSTNFLYCELIDTYQVIRSLSDAGAISQLTSSERNAIATALQDFEMYKGYSHLSEDYTSIPLLYTLINTFELYNRSGELNEQLLYNHIEHSSILELASNAEGFVSYINFEPTYLSYRSRPYEYYYQGAHTYITEADNSLITHKNTYMALSSLMTLEMVDEFKTMHDLSDLLQSIIDSQFLEVGYENYGGFLRFKSDTLGSPDFQNNYIFLKYSYFAIKALEILSEYLGLGEVKDLAFNVQALREYIQAKITEFPSLLFFDPHYTDDPAVLMEHTYFAIYILKAIDEYTLADEKVKNFVLSYVDYSNVRNTYYAYKLSKIIEAEITLNYDAIYTLVQDVYSEEYKEFYETSALNKLNQELLLWIAEIDIHIFNCSSLVVNVDHLEGIEFLSTGNVINFSIISNFSGTYWYWVDDILINSSGYYAGGDTLTYSLDEFNDKLDNHTVKINATSVNEQYSVSCNLTPICTLVIKVII